MLTGGDGYRSIAAGQNAIDLGYILADVVADYIAANSPVSVAVDGRIIEGASLSEPAAVRP
jgi:5'-nucleotidase